MEKRRVDYLIEKERFFYFPRCFCEYSAYHESSAYCGYRCCQDGEQERRNAESANAKGFFSKIDQEGLQCLMRI